MFQKLIIILICIFCAGFVCAEDYSDQGELIAQFNPDGQKYGFVKNYANALKYIHDNELSRKKNPALNEESLMDPLVTEALMENLIQENANLRVSRNYLKSFSSVENGLMLKVMLLFTEMCDEHIEFNNQERQMLDDLSAAQETKTLDSFEKQAFIKGYEILASDRRNSMSKLLEASMLIEKVLMSSDVDEYGEFTKLGITSTQRDKLLKKLYAFDGEGFEGEVREGQSFFEASVVAICLVLEDERWETLQE